jgi:hypothetical protein
LRIQAKRLELLRPLHRSIAQPLDINAARQAALDSGSDAFGGKERQRDCHVDMTDAALVAFGYGSRVRVHLAVSKPRGAVRNIRTALVNLADEMPADEERT